MDREYDFKALENKWRPYWQEIDLYRTGTDAEKPKHYILDFFPYPSGDGLSVGHCRNYVPTCVSARFKRMTGYNVLHPMGWDAFGLPAENYAIKMGVHPRITTAQNNSNYRRQMMLVECSYDWSREFSSTDPDYYRWTQYFFNLLFKRGLAYQAMGSQWWCPKDKTILANEQVENGRCWRCGTVVTKKDLKQWYFSITDYADRLLQGLERIEWPESIKTMQRNWIGRSEGAEVVFPVASEMAANGPDPWEIVTFTTRPDTLFGVTFLALAPEHPLVDAITIERHRPQVKSYIEAAQRRTEIDRLAAENEKTGVFTGGYAIHPLTNAKIPIWVADYVLMEYGSGAVMGVPGHDTRDFAFAQKYSIPIIAVIEPPSDTQDLPEQAWETDDGCFTGYGMMINSEAYSGLSSEQGGRQVASDLGERGLGKPAVTYKMHDWLISRQRYWGAPIPIIHCPVCGTVPVPDEDLPVILPDIDDFEPTGDGRSPLAKVDAWVNVPCPQCGEAAQRETDTMDGFACSSWYFLRFASPHFQDGPFEPQAMNYWLPVDTYVGGAEHAVMHLLYARFWTKVMFDAGLIHFDEPFSEPRNQGVLHAADGQRMSKSKGNVVTPDEVVAEHGTDALRTYILFIGPFDGDVIWDHRNIKGVNRFLERYWKLVVEKFGRRSNIIEGEETVTLTSGEELFRREQHRLVQRVTADYERYKFNTAVAALMGYLNYMVDQQGIDIRASLWRTAIETFNKMLAPIAPFITEQIWQEILGHKGQSVHLEHWPDFDPSLIVVKEITMMIQVNGKLRDKVEVPAGAEDDVITEAAIAQPNVQRHIDGQTVRRIIIVPQKLINIVAS